MAKGNLTKQIQKILEDVEYWQPDMIIQTKGVLFKMSSKWSKVKTKEIVELIKSFEFYIPQGQTTRYFKLTDEDFEK